MMTLSLLRIAVAISICAAFAMPTVASAQQKQKKVSYEQAWKLCKAALDKEGPATPLNTNDRYIRGGACMAKFGYGF
jgi:hypothetical protein